MAVLCSIAEAKNIQNPSRRFIVSGRNVRQAGNVVRQCYNTLVLWLMNESLKVSRRGRKENSITKRTKLFWMSLMVSKKMKMVSLVSKSNKVTEMRLAKSCHTDYLKS